MAVENRRVSVALGVGFDGLVAGGAGAVDAQEEVPASGVDEPELFDARSMAGGREPFGILPREGVADDLDDEIGRAFQPVGMAYRLLRRSRVGYVLGYGSTAGEHRRDARGRRRNRLRADS